MEKPVLHVNLRLVFFITFVLFGFNVSSKPETRYFLIEDNPRTYRLSTFDLSTRSLYGIDRKITLFNIMFDDFGVASNSESGKIKTEKAPIFLFSVLPDLENNSDWKEISLDSVKDKMIHLDYLNSLFIANTMGVPEQIQRDVTKYFNDYQVIVKKSGKYLVSKNCLLQFYSVCNRPDPFTTADNTINIKSAPISVLNFEKIFKNAYPHDTYPLYTIGDNNTFTVFQRMRDRRAYLSKIYKVANGETAYQFWTFADWHEHLQYYEFDRGIDRFVYTAEKGIIGGSFDFYFYFNRKKIGMKFSSFMNNIKEEKVMIADGL